MKKPTVHFARVIGFIDFHERGVCALLGGVPDHPKLGRQEEVRTSLVQKITHDDKNAVVSIETLNTKYVRE